MARDYKSRAHGESAAGQPSPAWAWFGSGMLVGLLLSGLLWLKLERPPKEPVAVLHPAPVEAPAAASAPVKEAKEAKGEKGEKALPPKPRFDFYTILPEMEVVVPEPEDEPTPAKAPVVEAQPALVKEPDSAPAIVTAPAAARVPGTTTAPVTAAATPAPAPVPAPIPAPATAPAAAAPATSYILQMGSFRRHEDADRLKASLALVGVAAEIQRVNVGGGETYFRVRSGPYSNSKQINELRARLEQNKISSILVKLK